MKNMGVMGLFVCDIGCSSGIGISQGIGISPGIGIKCSICLGHGIGIGATMQNLSLLP